MSSATTGGSKIRDIMEAALTIGGGECNDRDELYKATRLLSAKFGLLSMCRMNSLVIQDADSGRNDEIHKSVEKAYRLILEHNLEILFRNLCRTRTEGHKFDSYMENMANLLALAARFDETSSGIKIIDEDPMVLFDKSWGNFCQIYQLPPETLDAVGQEIIEKIFTGTAQKQPLLNSERINIVGPDTNIDVRDILAPGYQTPEQNYDPDAPPPRYAPGGSSNSSSSRASIHTIESEADRKRRMVESDEHSDELAKIFAQSEIVATSASSSAADSMSGLQSQTQPSITRISGVVREAVLEVGNNSSPNPSPSQPRTMPNGEVIINEVML